MPEALGESAIIEGGGKRDIGAGEDATTRQYCDVL